MRRKRYYYSERSYSASCLIRFITLSDNSGLHFLTIQGFRSKIYFTKYFWNLKNGFSAFSLIFFLAKRLYYSRFWQFSYMLHNLSKLNPRKTRNNVVPCGRILSELIPFSSFSLSSSILVLVNVNVRCGAASSEVNPRRLTRTRGVIFLLSLFNVQCCLSFTRVRKESINYIDCFSGINILM